MKIKSILFALLIGVGSLAHAQTTREVLWEQLIPQGWDPYKLFDQYTAEEYDALSDEDYMALQDKAQEMLAKAPVVAELDGKRVKIPGFVLPLEYKGTAVSEFLLVPYFGACIHTPPPPANQIIKGTLEKSYALTEIRRPVWISGKLKTGMITSSLGEAGYAQNTGVNSGYSMEVESIEPYLE